VDTGGVAKAAPGFTGAVDDDLYRDDASYVRDGQSEDEYSLGERGVET
jgi:hypothetical protein